MEASAAENAQPRDELTASGSSLSEERTPNATPSPSDSLEDGSSREFEKDLEKGDDDAQQEPQSAAEKEKQSDLVEFDGPNDPGNPKNWTKRRRWAITISMGLMTFVVTFASSIFSVAIDSVSKEYHVSTVVSTLGVSLFLLVSHSPGYGIVSRREANACHRDSSWVLSPSVQPQKYSVAESHSSLGTFCSGSSRFPLQ